MEDDRLREASITWAWWPGGGANERAHLLPVGRVPASRLRFDSDLWGTEAIFPDRHPIGMLGSDRYVFFNPQRENILFQLRAEESKVHLVSSSVAFLASSIAIYAAWYSRFLLVKDDDPGAASAAAEEAARQLHAVEGKDPNSYWPAAARDWQMQF